MEAKKMTVIEALAKIQSELQVPKDKPNSFGGYMYRSAEDILAKAKPLMERYGCLLTLSDEMVEICGKPYVKSTATFSAGGDESLTATAYARESLSRKGMDEPQMTGTASSYARKYALNGLFLLDDVKDPDTDEYHKETEKRSEAYEAEKKKQQEEAEAKPITKLQVESIRRGCQKYQVDEKDLAKIYHRKTIEEMTRKDFANFCSAPDGILRGIAGAQV